MCHHASSRTQCVLFPPPLKAFATKLAFSHSELPVVARLLEEVDAAAAGLLEVLLAKLRGSVQLPECLRIIGYLRRLAAFSEQVRLNPEVVLSLSILPDSQPESKPESEPESVQGHTFSLAYTRLMLTFLFAVFVFYYNGNPPLPRVIS